MAQEYIWPPGDPAYDYPLIGDNPDYIDDSPLATTTTNKAVVDKNPGAASNIGSQDYGGNYGVQYNPYSQQSNNGTLEQQPNGIVVMDFDSKRAYIKPKKDTQVRISPLFDKRSLRRQKELSVLIEKEEGRRRKEEEERRIKLEEEKKKKPTGQPPVGGAGGTGGEPCDCDKEKKEETGKEIGDKAAQAGNNAAGSGGGTGGSSAGGGTAGNSTGGGNGGTGTGDSASGGCDCSGGGNSNGSSGAPESVKDKKNPVTNKNEISGIGVWLVEQKKSSTSVTTHRQKHDTQDVIDYNSKYEKFRKREYVPFTSEIAGIPSNRYTTVVEKTVIQRTPHLKNREIGSDLLEHYFQYAKGLEKIVVESGKRVEEIDTKLKQMIDYFNLHIVFDIAMFWNQYYWGPQVAQEVFQEGPLEQMARDIANLVIEYEKEILKYNENSRSLRETQNSIARILKITDFINFGDGVILERLDYNPSENSTTSFATVAGLGISVHKNSKTAESTYVIYEIIIDGITYKFGIADAARRTAGNVPVRLAQQISKLRQIIAAEGGIIKVTYKIKQVMRTQKGVILDAETYLVLKRMEDLGIPLGNLSHIKKFTNTKIRKLSPKALKLLSKYLKI